MRQTFNSELMYYGDVFVGVNLGADFCAEHEWGIKELQHAFGLNNDAMGIERYRNNIVPNGQGIKLETTSFTYRKTPWYGLYFNCQHYGNKNDKTKNYLPFPYNYTDDSMTAGWDSKSFGLVVHKSKKWVIDELVTAINNCDLAIGLGSSGPFKNGGLKLMIISKVPQEIKDVILADHKDYAKLMDSVKQTKIEKILEKHDKKYYALSPAWYNPEFEPQGRKLNTKYNVVFFLNPEKQNENNSGWFTVEDLIDWTNGIGVIPKYPIAKKNSPIDKLKKLF